MYLFSMCFGGVLFGLGLIVSGMIHPANILGFLDVSNPWNPELAWVMGGALLVGLPAFSYAKRRHHALLGEPMHLPSPQPISSRLIVGSILFGLGWGLAGFCPGPALVALSMGMPDAAVFVVAMLVGMGLFEWYERRRLRTHISTPCA